MADDSGGLSIPSTDNWTEWTFEQALKALTGEGDDLHAAAKATWFNFNPSPGASDQIVYHAWGDYFYGVNVNNDAVTKWSQVVDTINELMPDVARGKRGSMDLQTLRDLEGAIRDFGGWAQAVGGGMTQWSNRLDSDDSSFRGKAAFLIYWRLKANGDGLNDTYEQVNSRHGRPIADAVGDAANELANFNSTMSGNWSTAYTLNIADWINNSLVSEINAVHQYAIDSGIQVGEPGYKLDAFGKDVDAGKAFIRTVLQNYPKGDLTSASGWQKIGDGITQVALGNLKNLLDTPAQTAISTLAPKYVLATSSLIEITPPPTETPPQPDPSNGDGGGGGGGDDSNLPPPPDGGGGGNIPPPGGDGGGDGGGGGDIPPPDGGGGGDIPPPDGSGGGGDIPPPDGSGGGGGLDLGGADGGGGDNGLNPPDGGGDGGLNVPGGDGPPADGGNGAFVPSLVPPGGGGSDANGGGTDGGIGPGGDGAFDENGGGDGVITPPDGGTGGSDGSLLPPGTGKSDTVVPPGGGADGSGGLNGGFGSDPGKNFDPGGGLGDGLGNGTGAGGGFGGGVGNAGGGAGGGLGGVGAGAGGGVGGVGGGLGGGLGGAGGVGGAGLGNTGLGSGGVLAGAPAQLSGGSPGANGAPGSSGGSDGSGGVPFYPPMMGGAGAGGEKPQERERQTWLSEDEEIWGTRVDVGSGVIGRLDEEEFEVEEIPLAGPSRRARPDKRQRRRDENERRREEIQAPGEESGSASAT